MQIKTKLGVALTTARRRKYLEMSVDKGWFRLVRQLIDELLLLKKDIRVLGIKEKYGGLSFHFYPYSYDIYNIVRKYEMKSYIVCEICGKEGRLREDLVWVKTMCDKHYAEKKFKHLKKQKTI